MSVWTEGNTGKLDLLAVAKHKQRRSEETAIVTRVVPRRDMYIYLTSWRTEHRWI